jgi:hypothetical protein
VDEAVKDVKSGDIVLSAGESPSQRSAVPDVEADSQASDCAVPPKPSSPPCTAVPTSKI